MKQQPMPELLPFLKKLKLSGISEHLATRNREAITGKLSYTEFLGLLLQDEILRREQSKFKRRVQYAGFKSDKTIESFDFGFNPKINEAEIKDLATCRFIEEKSPVLIVGPCGTGKSHLAQALGHCAVRCGHDVLFTTQSKIAAQLQGARAMNSYQNALKTYTRVKLLIIDDFGLKPLQLPQDEELHDIIAERYENHPTIITSNLDFDEWSDAFPNKILGAATIDRLRHNAYQVVLEGESYRTVKEVRNSKKIALEKN